MKLAIIDIETTGGSAKRERIIEFAAVIYHEGIVIEEYQTLINPERNIPPFITHMTGITNEMVATAPKFYEVARKIIEITQDCVFVAHNVRFDYSFVTEEYSNLGYTYSRKQLCTIKLFRKLFPGLNSYSLEKLIKYFDISVMRRHRAMDDVMATLEIMKKGMEKPGSSFLLNTLLNTSMLETKYPPNLNIESINKLPEKTGIYYFHNEYGDTIYVGKSINIKKRVKQHFQKISAKSNSLYNMTHSIDYELTGSELIASIREAEEIKKLKPELNKSLKRTDYPYVLVTDQNERGYITFKIRRSFKNEPGVINFFSSRSSAKSYLEKIVTELFLCRKLSGLEEFGDQCLGYKTGKCLGACIGEETPASYNSRIVDFFENNKIYHKDDFAIIDIGREPDEISVVLIEENKMRSFEYLRADDIAVNSLADIKAIVKTKNYDRDFNSIIRRYLNEPTGRFKIIT